MSDVQKVITIPAEELDFDNAPTFCQSGHADFSGKGLRTYNYAVVTSPGAKDVSVSPGGMLLKIQDGSLLFFDTDGFNSHFSRLLKNGEQVKLSKPVSVQLAEIRHAEDMAHLKDVGTLMGTSALENVAGVVDGIKGKVVKSEAAKQIRETANDLKTGTREIFAGAKAELKTAWNSDTARSARTRLRRLAWGKFGKGENPGNG